MCLLPAAHYDALCTQIRHDRRLWLGVAFAAVGSAWRLVGHALAVTPVTWFIGFMAMALLLPTEAAQLVVAIREAPADALVYGLARLLGVTTTLIASYRILADAMRGRLDFNNPFDAAIAARLRQTFEVPAVGDLRVEVERVTVASAA